MSPLYEYECENCKRQLSMLLKQPFPWLGCESCGGKSTLIISGKQYFKLKGEGFYKKSLDK